MTASGGKRGGVQQQPPDILCNTSVLVDIGTNN